MMSLSLRRVFILLQCGCLAALAAGCAELQSAGGLVPLAKTAVETATKYPSFTDADEARMAQENARKFEAEHRMWDDPLLETYLTEIMQRIVAGAKPRPFDYRLRVVRDPAVNAFTFGGGLVYVHAGLIARMENEAQLAMVLAHELAHVTESHVPAGITGAYGIQILGQLAAVAASATGTLQGPALQAAYEYTMKAAINGHSRGRESEADEVGLDYLVKAGYDPREAPRTFEQLLKEHGDQAPLVNFFYGSHPTNVARIERLTELGRAKYADQLAQRRFLVNTEEFKRRTRELVVAVGRLDYEGKRFNTAKAMFEKALRVRPDDPVPHYYLGKLALETGSGPDVADRAIAHLTEAIKAEATFAPAYRELGLAYYRKRDNRQAVTALQRYLSLHPKADDARRIAAMIDELRRY